MKCCICGKEIEAYQSNNPRPIRREDGRILDGDTERCCNECNHKFVVPYRICKAKNYDRDVLELQDQIFKLRKAANLTIKKKCVICTIERKDGTVYEQRCEYIDSLKRSMLLLQQQLGKGYYVCYGRVEAN